jgi:hypothetical protein|tara:strand:- start:808 stop:1299 length:492 start_codon:yes stop_codon:yes gene_type:complete
MESKHTSLESTNRYIERLNEWTHGGHDRRDFPHNAEQDIILILNPDSLYIPDSGYMTDPLGFVRQDYCKEKESVDSLKNSAAEVTGFSPFNYYNPWEADLKLKCVDENERYFGAGNAGSDFIFVPHPKMFKIFRKLIPSLPCASKLELLNQISIRTLEEYLNI